MIRQAVPKWDRRIGSLSRSRGFFAPHSAPRSAARWVRNYERELAAVAAAGGGLAIAGF
jgi:hypothetical protein